MTVLTTQIDTNRNIVIISLDSPQYFYGSTHLEPLSTKALQFANFFVVDFENKVLPSLMFMEWTLGINESSMIQQNYKFLINYKTGDASGATPCLTMPRTCSQYFLPKTLTIFLLAAVPYSCQKCVLKK